MLFRFIRGMKAKLADPKAGTERFAVQKHELERNVLIPWACATRKYRKEAL